MAPEAEFSVNTDGIIEQTATEFVDIPDSATDREVLAAIFQVVSDNNRRIIAIETLIGQTVQQFTSGGGMKQAMQLMSGMFGR